LTASWFVIATGNAITRKGAKLSLEYMESGNCNPKGAIEGGEQNCPWLSFSKKRKDRTESTSDLLREKGAPFPTVSQSGEVVRLGAQGSSFPFPSGDLGQKLGYPSCIHSAVKTSETCQNRITNGGGGGNLALFGLLL